VRQELHLQDVLHNVKSRVSAFLALGCCIAMAPVREGWFGVKYRTKRMPQSGVAEGLFLLRDLPWSGGRTGGRDRDVGRNAGIAGWSLWCYPPRTLARRDASKFATPFRMNPSSSSLVTMFRQ